MDQELSSVEKSRQNSPVHLLAYTEADRSALTALLTDPEVMKHVDGVKSVDVIDRLFSRFLGLTPTADEIWAIRLTESNEYVGHAALFVSEICAADEREILFYLHKKFWGQGLAFAAASLMITRAQQQKHRRIWATVDSDHTPSIRICENLGMIFDRREHDDDGEFLVYRYDVH